MGKQEAVPLDPWIIDEIKKKEEKEKRKREDQPRAPEPHNPNSDIDEHAPKKPTTVPAGDYGWGNTEEEDKDKITINIKDLPTTPRESDEE